MRCCLFLITVLTPLYINGVEFSKWRSYDEINQFLDEAVNKFSHLSMEVLGQSVERRNIKVVKIQRTSGWSAGKIYIQAGLHAREWITPASTLYLINRLAEECNNGNAISYNSKPVCNFQWHIVPLVNPDGYEFSRLKNEGQCPGPVKGRSGGKGCRSWRKNRRKGVCSTPESDGVDLNRNFAKLWKSSGGCNETYNGESPFSEPETMAVKKYIENKINPRDSRYPYMDIQRAAIDVHSFSQVILIPEDMNKHDEEYVRRVGRAMNNAIEGKDYRIDTVSQFFDFNRPKECNDPPNKRNDFRANGTAMDWFHYGAGIKRSFTIELSPGLCSSRGQTTTFYEEEENIVPIAKQLYQASVGLADELWKEFVKLMIVVG